MKIKFISLPFHYVHPYAPAEFRHCLASIPVYDPQGRDLNADQIAAVRKISFAAAVATVPQTVCRGDVSPKTVILPVCQRLTWQMRGCNKQPRPALAVPEVTYRSFQVDDLMQMPLAVAPSKDVSPKILKKFRELYHEEA